MKSCRLAIIFALAFVVLLTGCAASTNGREGHDFANLTGDPDKDYALLHQLADEMISQGKGSWGGAHVIAYLRGKLDTRKELSTPDWKYSARTKSEEFNWKTAQTKKKTVSIPVYSWRESEKVGYKMTVLLPEGKLFDVIVERVSSKEMEDMLTSNELLLLGVAAGAALLLAP